MSGSPSLSASHSDCHVRQVVGVRVHEAAPFCGVPQRIVEYSGRVAGVGAERDRARERQRAWDARRIEEVVGVAGFTRVAVANHEVGAVGRRARDRVAHVLDDAAGRIVRRHRDIHGRAANGIFISRDGVHVVVGALLHVLEVHAEAAERGRQRLHVEVDDLVRRLIQALRRGNPEAADGFRKRHQCDRIAGDANLDLRQRRCERDRERLQVLRVRLRIEVVDQAEVCDAGRIEAAFLGRRLGRQAADVGEAVDGLRCRRAVVDSAGLADEIQAGATDLVVPDVVAESRRIETGNVAGVAAEGVARHLVRVVGRARVADDGLERLRAAQRCGVVRVRRGVPGGHAEPDPGLLGIVGARAEGARRRRLAREVADRLVHHFGDGVTPHRAVAGRVGAVRDPAAIVVIAGCAREARDAHAVDRVDDAGRAQQVELPRSEVDLALHGLDGFAQYAAIVRLTVRARDEPEQHRVVLPVILQQANGLCVRSIRPAIRRCHVVRARRADLHAYDFVVWRDATERVDPRVGHGALFADPIPDARVLHVLDDAKHRQPNAIDGGIRVHLHGRARRRRVGEKVAARAGSRGLGERRVVLDGVSVRRSVRVFLAPAMRVLRNERSLQHGFRGRVGGAQAAVEHFAHRVDAAHRHVIEPVAAPFRGTGASLVRRRARRCKDVAPVRVAAIRFEIAVVVDLGGLITGVEDIVAVQVRRVVVGLVVHAVVAAHHQHIERRHRSRQKQRHVRDVERGRRCGAHRQPVEDASGDVRDIACMFHRDFLFTVADQRR